ncbi:MAG: hypothetical protein EAZ65_07200 [Verrucomicrobia bacterium]|nr:MAG: hypothetical protein EAZ84_09465 [Verrucomicrobiota bacterium]TAE87391.1 MAG: hypothetical protein EAZ82_08180 [Verrucomicrobiota bacterium]TAF25245.1 MAG: hypothetical protein EAZ71_08405 [Verrucomicrobiota bacterium]TAF40892.1 MAG: hypothetical protein EAZ65_07200 [Verrucomicrobiota bacterium]
MRGTSLRASPLFRWHLDTPGKKAILRAVLPTLDLWIDPIPRDGPENMAIDDWLAENADTPVLRSYRWTPDWGSLGYFVKAATLPPNGLRWVRRPTGGGIVDHRADWTYTLFIPNGFGLAEAKGAESYRVIHSALVTALRAGGIDAQLAGSQPSTPGGECFRHAVEFDVITPDARKIAGAGQRRNRHGLLHQGSVATPSPIPLELAASLSEIVTPKKVSPPISFIAEQIQDRYGRSEWTLRR